MIALNTFIFVFILFVAIHETIGAENHQYVKVPGHEEYEFGYHRGNADHFQERQESRHGPSFKTKVRWSDSKGGHGEHLYDYNHDDKHGHHDDHH